MKAYCRFYFLVILTLFSLLCPLYIEAQSVAEGSFRQKIEWEASGGAYYYELEVQQMPAAAETGSLLYRTDSTFYELNLHAGSYRYRVHVYNVLGLEATVSRWFNFVVTKASVPRISDIGDSVKLSANSTYLILDMDIKDVALATLVELVNEDTGESVRGALLVENNSSAKNTDREGSEVLSAKRAVFSDIEPGVYHLRFTNPSGLKASSKSFSVLESDPILEVVKIDEVPEEYYSFIVPPEPEPEPEVEEPEPEPEVEEPEPAPPPEPEPEPTPEPEPEPAPEPKVESAVAEEKPRFLELNFMAGGGIIWNLYGDYLFSVHSDSELPLLASANLSVSFYPLQMDDQMFGLELDFDMALPPFSKNTGYYEERLFMFLPRLSIAYRHRFFIDNLFLGVKAGGGVSLFWQYVEYSAYYQNRGQDKNMLPPAPLAYGGLGFAFIPTKHAVLEAGAEFMHIFGGSVNMGFLMPYLKAGIRF